MSWGGATNIKKMADSVASQVPAIGNAFAIETIDGGTGDQDVAAAIRLGLASGQNLPDIAQLNRTQVAEFAASGELLELNDIIGGADLYAGAQELSKVGDTAVAFPFELKSKLFYYRKDLYDAAGVDLGSLDTVDGFIAAGKALQEKAGTNIINLGPQPAGYYLGELVSAYADSRFFADESGAFTVTTNPAFKDAFGFLKTLFDSSVTNKIDDWSSDWQPAIADNKVASFLNANWLKFFLPSFAPEQSGKWSVGLWPKLSPLADQRYGSEAGGSVFVILKRAPNAAAAAEYLRKLLLEKEGAIAAYNAIGMTPLIKAARDEFLEKSRHPVKPEGMSDTDFALQPGNYFGPTFAETELGSYDYVKVLKYDPAASKGLDIINQWLQKHLAGTDLDTALSSAQADMESQIGNPFDA
jgi:ABC-type glycerol-3-phosphate transport system substrate-binding protein